MRKLPDEHRRLPWAIRISATEVGIILEAARLRGINEPRTYARDAAVARAKRDIARYRKGA